MKTIAELAAESFDAQERVRGMAIQNVAGMDYEERKKAAIEYAEAQARAASAKAALDVAIRNAK